LEIRSLELLADHLCWLQAGDHFHLEVKVNHLPVLELASRDHYHLSGLVLGGRRLAATGRERDYSYSHWAGRASVEADPPEARQLMLETWDHPRLYITTNAFRNPGCLAVQTVLRWCYGPGYRLLELPLRSPAVDVECLDRHRYMLDLTPWLRVLWQEGAKKLGRVAPGPK